MTAWVEVNVGALAHNAAQVRALLPPGCRLCAVVKANGYGHGAVLAAQAFASGGAEWLAVTTVDEGVELRQAGLALPILVLASSLPAEAEAVLAHGLTATVSSLAGAQALAAAAARTGRTAPVHLLVDTGMGRDGVLPDQAPALATEVARLEHLALEGVFTHFPQSSAADKAPTRAQLARFLGTVDALRPRPLLVHAANSGACVDLAESRLDLVRVGTLLYGQYPSSHVTRALELRDTWRLRGCLVEVRRLPAGATIGYGSEARLRESRLLGTLLVGWQHGFTLQPTSLWRGLRGVKAWLRPEQPYVTVRGVRCPVVGRVAMQSCVVDVSAVPDPVVGDVATVPCRRVVADRGLPRLVVT